MTAIASVIEDGKIFMGGDACGSLGNSILICDDPKVFKLGKNFIIGHCGQGRIGSVVKYCFKPPPRPKRMDADTYMSSKFAAKLRDCFRENGCLSTNDGVEFMSGMLLVGYESEVYMVDSEFCAYRLVNKYAAIGSGSEVVLGALHVTKEVPARERILKALEAAESFVEGVRAPFTVMEL